MLAPTQFNLDLKLAEQRRFDNFLLHDRNNAMAVSVLETFCQFSPLAEQIMLLWGEQDVGLTHLLEAASFEAQKNCLSVGYLDMLNQREHKPTFVLDGLDDHLLVCLDNIDAVAGNELWEEAIFHLFNNLRDRGHKLLMASHTQPVAMGINLPDLQSRLLGCVSFEINALGDEHKKRLLLQRAQAIGLDMPNEVARFIIERAPRHIHTLFNLLDALDGASLREQRKITIPFVKSVLHL